MLVSSTEIAQSTAGGELCGLKVLSHRVDSTELDTSTLKQWLQLRFDFYSTPFNSHLTLQRSSTAIR